MLLSKKPKQTLLIKDYGEGMANILLIVDGWEIAVYDD